MDEHLVSVLGLLALLGLAFACSNNHRAVNPRTLVWGMSLQMLFAVIILKRGDASVLGLFVLVLLIMVYLLEQEVVRRSSGDASEVAAGAKGVTAVALASMLGLIAGRAAFGSFAASGTTTASIAAAVAAAVVALLVFLVLRFRGGEGTRLDRRAALYGLGLVAAAALVVALFSKLPGVVTATVLGLALALWLVSFVLPKGPRTSSLTQGVFVALLLVGLARMIAVGVDGADVFGAATDKVAEFLALSIEGSLFLFGNLSLEQFFFPGPDAGWPGFGYQFAFVVLPTIIFFSAFMSVMYYLGVVQVVVQSLARFMRWSLRTSGSETLSCSANVFVGQTEAPFLIKPFLKDMTPSELHAVMCGGYATIAGGVLAAYIGMGIDPTHLIAASVMSAPAALVIAKLLYPETEESLTAGDVDIPEVQTAGNVVEAAAEGTADGLRLALNVGAMLIAFIALVAFLDWVLAFGDRWVDGVWLGGVMEGGEYRGWFPGSMKTLFGTLLAPLAFVMGVPWSDAAAVGNLLGTKITINEFVAYGFLGEHVLAGDLQDRSIVIATYALCGFANFSSIGIQIGGLSALEPSLRPTLSKVAVRALFGGALASFTTATVAGMLL